MATNAVTWTRGHTLSALHLYTLLPFGKLSQRTPEIQQLAKWQGRTPSSLAMKLVNFASLDPQITSTGRVGLSGASSQDRELWSELQSNWDEIAQEAATAYADLATTHGVAGDSPLIEEDEAVIEEEGQTRGALVQVRVNQARFRRVVLASYGSTCCISGLKHPSLLVASHIVPWSRDTKNRMNPKNGLCLSAIHDRAYDQGLITVLPDYTVRLCNSLRSTESSSPLSQMLANCEGQRIANPERFAPNPEFLEWHATHFGFL
jgi:putative restriction endonuclease